MWNTKTFSMIKKSGVIVENDERMKLKHQKRMKRIIERVNTMKQTNDKKSVKSFPYVISLN